MIDPAKPIRKQSRDDLASPGEAADERHCPNCRADLSHLPIAARYCPQCGLDTQIAAEAQAGRTRSPLLRGFAGALYRLGVRYEASLGARHNPAEAERCYFKAAKLGNPAAIARVSGLAEPDNSPTAPNSP